MRRQAARAYNALARTRVGTIGRKIRLNRLVHITLRVGAVTYLRALYVKKFVMKSIAAMPHLRGNGAAFEVHMLLQHERILEGTWALYSFQHFSQAGAAIVIHDDGSLTGADRSLLQALFSPISIVDRDKADVECTDRLKVLGLSRLLNFRDSLVFALKMIDPVLMSRSEAVVIMDSDVLFFRQPTEVVSAVSVARAAYSECCCYCYCASPERLREIVGLTPIALFNPGVFILDPRQISLENWNEYLRYPDFWDADGMPNYYSELSLWACEMTRLGATPLPPSYQICAPEPENAHFGHYCGGDSHHSALFYTRGIPFLQRALMLR